MGLLTYIVFRLGVCLLVMAAYVFFASVADTCLCYSLWVLCCLLVVRWFCWFGVVLHVWITVCSLVVLFGMLVWLIYVGYVCNTACCNWRLWCCARVLVVINFCVLYTLCAYGLQM